MTEIPKEVKYIGFYDLPEGPFNRVATLSAINKMDYICDAINRAGYKAHIVSPSWLSDKAKGEGFIKSTTTEVSPNKKVTFSPSYGTINKLTRNIKIVYTLIWLSIWLIKNTRKNEKILVYHTPWLSLPVRWAKRFKNFRLILEVEEVYSDVSLIHPYFKTLEFDLFKCADYYIFSTELLNERINRINKPFLVLYGAYTIHDKIAKPYDDGKIHLLYAGIIDFHKAGAFSITEASVYLTDNYVLHIIGFGEIEKLKEKVKELNLTNQCKIVFDGEKRGEEYIKYCQRCQIGISSQKMIGAYVESSFPSKILSYLGLGLRVVSCEIDCVKESLLNNLIDYYTDDSPEAIAQAIMSVDLSADFDSTQVLRELDRNFVRDVRTLFDN